MPDDPKEVIPRHVDAILYSKDDNLDEDASAYERLMIYNFAVPVRRIDRGKGNRRRHGRVG